MYSVIVFDLGNVLIPFDYQIVVKKFNRIKPGLGDKFYKLYEENYNIHRDFEKGIINTEQFLTIMLEWLEGKVFGKKFCRIYSSLFSVNQNVVDLLPALKKKKYKLVLLSNTNPIHKKYGYEHLDFLKFFDKLILSHEVKSLKPEKEIYKAVESFTGKPSKEHFIIDDIKEYVDAAKKCGWDGVQFKNYVQLIIDLRKKNILLP
mgnify:CR=1 FL=1